MTQTYLQSSEFTAVISPITGNSLIRNDSEDKYLMAPDFDAARAAFICSKLQSDWSPNEFWKRLDSTKYEAAFLALAVARRKSSFVAAFNKLIEVIVDADDKDKDLLNRAGIRRRFAELTNLLWQADLLAAPVKNPLGGKVTTRFDAIFLARRFSWIYEIEKASNSTAESGRRHAALHAWRLAMTSIGVKEIGDITPGTVRKEVLNYKHGVAAATIRPLLIIQRRIYGSKVHITEHDWGVGRGKPKRLIDFSEVVTVDRSLLDWQQLFNLWITSGVTGGVATKRDAITGFFRYLLEHRDVTRDPLEYVSRHYHPPQRYEAWIDTLGNDPATVAKRIGQIAGFFDWYVDAKLCMEDDYGRPVRNPELFNPIIRRREPTKASETARDALPVKFIHELIRIISENDFAWPKSLSEDYIKHYDDKTGEWVRVWCPIRTHAMLVKLYLPLRTYQVVMLDSGEADTEIYADGKWETNKEPLAPSDKSIVRKGFLRRYRDHSIGTDFTGFYVNTNKTADRFKSNTDRGYEIPWQHEDVIAVVKKTIEWQTKYNPIHRPTRWVDLTNPIFKRGYTEAQLKARGENCFLFRDPVRARKDQPIHPGRLSYYWGRLLDELEKRVASRGDTLPNGQPIRFILTRKKDGSPLVPAFDLHSLRVSILTALSVEGGVPLAVLSKCVAGHATILMTLYYLKQGPSYISQQLAAAQAKILDREKENYLRFLQDCDLKGAESIVACNDQIGLRAVQEKNTAGWIIGDLGICPVGGSMCSVGGSKLTGENGRNDFQGTPGGPRNCIRCRFFLSGPAFLGGLVAHFNSTGIEIIDASQHLREMEEEIIQMENNISESGETDSFAARRLDSLYGRMDTALSQLDETANNWHATYAMIERAKALVAVPADEEQPGTQVRLLATGDIADIGTALGKVTDFELFNDVCQHATVYPAPTVPSATLRRGRLLDAMLSRNDRRPVFASLTDKEALAVGNELVSFLYARLGHTETLRVIEGTRMLEAAGISEGMDSILAKRISEPVKMAELVRRKGGKAAKPNRKPALALTKEA